jgi:hypothetical protein
MNWGERERREVPADNNMISQIRAWCGADHTTYNARDGPRIDTSVRICILRHAHEVGLGRRAEVGVVHVVRWLQGESRVLVYGTSLYEDLVGRDVKSQDVEIYHLREGKHGRTGSMCTNTTASELWPYIPPARWRSRA